jgi:hypothetical protein
MQHFLLGQLTEAEAAGVESHLLGCARCLTTVHALETSDTLASVLRQAGALPARSEDEVVTALVGRLKQLPPAERPTRAGFPAGCLPLSAEATPLPEALALLAPAQAAGELGRLGPYRILRVLGAGGMGVVYEAEDTRLRRLVALKTLRPLLAAWPEARKRFLREARAVAGLNHEHIVAIYQVGEEGGLPYLAMPLLDGSNLEARIHREPPLSLVEVLRIGREVAEGLAAAHARDIVHRDIKPENIWLEGESVGRVKILDFGLARCCSSAGSQLTQAGAIVGSPAYMAPEQARGEEVDARSDLFSLGCVLYRLCTGCLPYPGKEVTAILLELALREPAPPREANPQVPEPLSALVMALLAKDPRQRPATARAVADALARLERDPTAAVPFAGTRGPGRWWEVAAAGAALLLAAALAFQVYLRITHPDGTTTDVELKPGDKITVVQKKAEAPAPAAKDSRPGPRVNGALIFQDDFTGKQPLAEALFADNVMTFTRDKGKGTLTGSHPGVLPVVYTEHKLQNFVAEFTLRVSKDHADASYGVLFRSDRDDGGLPRYYALVFSPGAAEAHLACWDNPNWTLSKKWPCPFDTDRDVAVRLEVVGKQFRVFVNNAFRFEATDETLSGEGLLCLAMTGPEQGSRTATYGKLRVYKAVP